jgi:hypothetical protein
MKEAVDYEFQEILTKISKISKNSEAKVLNLEVPGIFGKQFWIDLLKRSASLSNP